MSAATQGRGQAKNSEELSVRRFREVHYHRFKLGTRSNVHGTCVLRSQLPVRLPRPHAMQQIYNHPPPGVGYRRLVVPQWHDAMDHGSLLRVLSEHKASVVQEINDERATAARWLESERATSRAHVVVATQSNLLFFISGFGYWNVLDINLNLPNESCAGVKAFEMWTQPNDDGANRSFQKNEDAAGDDLPSIDQHKLPTLIIALTTYVKQPSEKREGVVDESGSYRLYALGADSLPPLPQSFVEKHALEARSNTFTNSNSKNAFQHDPPSPEHLVRRPDISEMRSNSQPIDLASTTDFGLETSQMPPERPASVPQTAEAYVAAGRNIFSPNDTPFAEHKDPADMVPLNSYAYLEERLFGLRVSDKTLRIGLNYLPFRISHDIVEGMPPVLLVAGNDNKIHRYALGCDRIVEIEPLLCPKTDVPLTYTVFDARAIGPFHIQITAHQEFSVALQVSRALTDKELEQEADGSCKGLVDSSDQKLMRRLLVADEEVYDAAPILATIFTPYSEIVDRSAYDFKVTRLTSSSAFSADTGGSSGEGNNNSNNEDNDSNSNKCQLAAGDVYNSEWPLGTAGLPAGPYGRRTADGPQQQQQQHLSASFSSEKPPRVHVLIGFIGEDAVIYHDVPVAGLDPVSTLVGGIAGKVPESASHISGRLGGLGGVFSLAGSSREGMITSVHCDDLDLDGSKEVIVGTVSGTVLIYKLIPEKGYVLVWKRRFPAPVYGIFSVDINCDGVNELVVVTLIGVHVMQPNLANIRAKLLRQLLLARNEQQNASKALVGDDGSR
ncbi:hypothetical protein H4217_007387 [Coemansia sp. RSA 1939]|nr:hypothetical protein H4217_007387 [Coemansia sp. RSA 1939]